MHRGVERFSFVRCRRCALVYLNPRVSPERLADYYGDSYLPHRGPAAWGRWARFVEQGQRRTDHGRVTWARKVARLGMGTAVLDVGCGRPTFLESLVDRTGARGVGLDVSDGGWTAEPERWSTAGLELHRGTVQQAAIEGPFDLVCMWHALEHDYQPMDTLRRLHGLTRPGGAILVEVPNYDSLTRRLAGLVVGRLPHPAAYGGVYAGHAAVDARARGLEGGTPGELRDARSVRAVVARTAGDPGPVSRRQPGVGVSAIHGGKAADVAGRGPAAMGEPRSSARGGEAGG